VQTVSAQSFSIHVSALSTLAFLIVSPVHFGFFMCHVCPLSNMTLTVLSTQRFKAHRLTYLKGTGAKNTETPHRPHLLKKEQVRKNYRHKKATPKGGAC
jgi:hypothetical protein